MIDDTTQPEIEPRPACNGYGTDDGLPCGTLARDFGAERPGRCAVCGGTGERAAADYDPIPKAVYDAYDAFVEAAAAAGFRVRDHLLHTDRVLESGDDRLVGSSGDERVTRYWPGITASGLHIAGNSPIPVEEWQR